MRIMSMIRDGPTLRMKKFFPALSRDKATSSINLEASETQHPSESIKVVDYELLETDPGIRPPISSYHPDIQNENVSKYGGDHFVTKGFSDWKNSQRLANHATSSNSHVDCVHMSYALMNPNQSIKAAFVNQTKQMNSEYCVRVNTSLIATKFLLRCGMPFRGSDESFNSLFKGSFLELVDTLKEINPEITNVIDYAMGNNFMTAPTIQKDLAAACACEITQQIVCDVADDVFCVLIDESNDVAGKEQMAVVIRYVNSEEDQIETSSGLNQELSIARAGDTRWGSHFRTLTSLMTIYGAIIEVLEEVGKDTSFEKYGETMLLLDVLQSFDFIFMLYMMVEILGFTNDLSVALQKRDQDLLNVLSLVKATKEELQEMRNDGWEELISKVMEIFNKHDIDVPDLDAPYVQGKKPRRHATTSSVSNLHHYKHDCLFSVLDLQLHELNARFDEENTELLQCVSCLSPSSSFEAFDVKKLLRMVELYPNDFVDEPEVVVRHQLQNYVRNV
ncbi:hypothetical protein D0Y65_004609 [Glycine soja]|uniref:DUF4371 domain-containing protein n=1 Tax=Glycine soja TaxID=3848 RepID=A0A445LSD2_GLYSO|nr:hypothetical protein D0Y65_004609 [Glycine soja]